MGKQYSDSPRYIYEAAVDGRAGPARVWTRSGPTPGAPTASRPTCRLVRRESWRYHLDLARAEFWVDNQGFPRVFARRPGDDLRPDLARDAAQADGLRLARRWSGPAPSVRRQHKAMMRRWSALLVPSEYFVETFVKSYGYDGAAGAARACRATTCWSAAWTTTGSTAKKRELGLPDRPAPGALLPDLPRPGPPARDAVRAAAGPRADAPRARRRRAPAAAHPLPGQLQALRRGSRRSPPTCRGTTTSPS